LFNANKASLKLYHAENKLYFYDDDVSFAGLVWFYYAN